MAAFTLDTSGVVNIGKAPPRGHNEYVEWSDLDPFTRGYVEAVFDWIASHHNEIAGKDFAAFQARGYRTLAFRDLAPETLAAILKDCAAWRSIDRGIYGEDNAACGRALWAMRQSQAGVPDFPRLTVTLGDDGKVRFQ